MPGQQVLEARLCTRQSYMFTRQGGTLQGHSRYLRLATKMPARRKIRSRLKPVVARHALLTTSLEALSLLSGFRELLARLHQYCKVPILRQLCHSTIQPYGMSDCQ